MPASNPRIDELRKKFDENPRRYFAPLANEYRKAGEIEQAIAICRQHLKEQPGHMSGHIVFGQALFEARQFDEARTIFESALQLDPENLIALRHLGDIERDLNPDAARGWYQRVLDADPRNEEIAGIIATLPVEAMEMPVAGEDSPPEESGTLASIDWSDMGIGDAAPAAEPVSTESSTLVIVAPVLPAAEEPPQAAAEMPAIELQAPMAEPTAEEMDLAFTTTAHLTPTASFDPSQIRPTPPTGTEGVSPLSGLSGNYEGYGTHHAEPPETPPAQMLDQHFSADDTMAIPAVPHPESLDVVDLETPAREPEPEALSIEPHAILEATPDHAEPVAQAAAPESAWQWEEPEPPAASEETDSPVFVTETMAELYVTQGLTEQAIAVYRQLVEHDPSDQRLRTRLAALEGAPPVDATEEPQQEWAPEPEVAPHAQEVTDALANHADQIVAADSGYTSPASNGETIGSLLARIAAWRPGLNSGQYAAQPEEAAQSYDEPAPAYDAPAPAYDAPAAYEAPAQPTYDPPAADDEVVQPASWQDTQPAEAFAQPAAAIASTEGGSLGSLFEGRPISAQDETAAQRLAEAFGQGTGTAVADAPVIGEPTRAALDEMTLDTVFRDAPRKSSETRRPASFTFDQFFTEGQGTAPESSGPGTGEKGDADIAQFNSWLSGLKKK